MLYTSPFYNGGTYGAVRGTQRSSKATLAGSELSDPVIHELRLEEGIKAIWKRERHRNQKLACPSSCNSKALNTVENNVTALCISELN